MNSTLPLDYVVKGTIKTTGTARRSVRPNCINLDAYLQTEAVTANESMRALMQEIQKLQAAFKEAGYEGPRVTTGRVSVDELHKKTRDDRRIRYGFSTKIRISVDTEYQPRILATLLQAVAKSGTEPELRVGYFVTNTDAVYNDLLGEAKLDARKRAQAIVEATGQKIGCLVRALDQESVRTSGGYRPFALFAPLGDNDATLGDFLDDNPDVIEFSTKVICSFEVLGEG